MTKLSKALIIYNLILLTIIAMMTVIILIHVVSANRSVSNIEASLQNFQLME